MSYAERFERRLAAVMAMDVAGYSRLMSLDEEGTFRRLRDKMRQIVLPAIAEAGGRVVKTTGDGALSELPAAAAAVECAARIQRLNEAAEEAQPVEGRIRFRIGISLGEIIVEQDDIFGDGVNIAARLEGIAEVGGISVSEAVATGGAESGFAFLDLGLRHLKNITRPVRVYKVALSGEAASGAVAGAALVQGFGERPAIAVLPFRFDGPPDQEPIADGITEDIISALSRWRSFPVISRNSVFPFKGKNLDPGFIGQQLGARYLADGTLLRRGSQWRATVQLTDVAMGENLLSEHFDSTLDDVFAMQDEVVRALLGAIEPELLRHERERVARTPPQDATAYERLQRGQWHHYRYTPQDNRQARAFFRHALAIDPNYAQAAAALSLALSQAAQSRWETDSTALHEEARAMARLAVQADGRDPQAHFALGVTLYHARLTEQAVQSLQQVIRLNPSHAAGHANLAFTYNYLNRAAEALEEVKLALRLSPHDPRRFIWLPALAGSSYLSADYRSALRAGQEALAINPSYLPIVRYIVASLGQLGQSEGARTVMTLLRKLDGDLAATEAHLRQYFVAPAVEHILDGLRKAGFT